LEKNAPNPVKKQSKKKQHRNSKKTNERTTAENNSRFFKTCVFYRSLVFYLIVIVVIAIAKPTYARKIHPTGQRCQQIVIKLFYESQFYWLQHFEWKTRQNAAIVTAYNFLRGMNHKNNGYIPQEAITVCKGIENYWRDFLIRS
jgi:hypothetical protein